MSRGRREAAPLDQGRESQSSSLCPAHNQGLWAWSSVFLRCFLRDSNTHRQVVRSGPLSLLEPTRGDKPEMRDRGMKQKRELGVSRVV